MGILKWWNRRKESLKRIKERDELFNKRAKAQIDITKKMLVAIETNNIELAEGLLADLESIPCPWCGK